MRRSGTVVVNADKRLAFHQRSFPHELCMCRLRPHFAAESSEARPRSSDHNLVGMTVFHGLVKVLKILLRPSCCHPRPIRPAPAAPRRKNLRNLSRTPRLADPYKSEAVAAAQPLKLSCTRFQSTCPLLGNMKSIGRPAIVK